MFDWGVRGGLCVFWHVSMARVCVSSVSNAILVYFQLVDVLTWHFAPFKEGFKNALLLF